MCTTYLLCVQRTQDVYAVYWRYAVHDIHREERTMAVAKKEARGERGGGALPLGAHGAARPSPSHLTDPGANRRRRGRDRRRGGRRGRHHAPPRHEARRRAHGGLPPRRRQGRPQGAHDRPGVPGADRTGGRDGLAGGDALLRRSDAGADARPSVDGRHAHRGDHAHAVADGSGRTGIVRARRPRPGRRLGDGRLAGRRPPSCTVRRRPRSPCGSTRSAMAGPAATRRVRRSPRRCAT